MKKAILSLIIAAIMIISVIPASAAATDYTKTENYTVPLDKFYGVGNDTYTSTVVTQTEFDGKNVIKMTKGDDGKSNCIVVGQDATDGFNGANAQSNQLSVRLGDYKYIVVKVYYDLAEGTGFGANHRPTLAITRNSDSIATAKLWSVYVKNASNATYANNPKLSQDAMLSGSLSDAGIFEDMWCYQILDISDVDLSQLTDGTNTLIQNIQYQPFANGANKNINLTDDCACYVQFMTFTNDYVALVTADMAADAAGDSGDNGDDGNNGGEDANTPEDTAADTTADTTAETVADTKADSEKTADTEEEKKSGCGSAIGFAIVPVAIAAGGACILKKKKKED